MRADLSAWQSIQKSTTALESTFDKSQNERAEIVFDKNAELQKVDSRIFQTPPFLLPQNLWIARGASGAANDRKANAKIK
ncbi:hypothetical protein [Helicobacter canis]|uniref:hypothetical protein n=1 Tax=Helicobacter canis TaxID=29419 RepID=UPI0011C07D65|nr:hypothetical protein [Helicobacter canis]